MMDSQAIPAGILLSEADPQSPEARVCLAAYYAELATRFPGGFDVSLSRDPEASAMIRPRGVFVLAVRDGAPVGCVGLKGLGTWGEIKRLWIAPAARGHGLSHRLMAVVEAAARELGMQKLRLDTNSRLAEATALYRRTGWEEIPRYNGDPYPDLFFEKTL